MIIVGLLCACAILLAAPPLIARRWLAAIARLFRGPP